MNERFDVFKKPAAVVMIATLGTLGLSACEAKDDPSAYTCVKETLTGGEDGDTKWELAKQALKNRGAKDTTDPVVLKVLDDTRNITLSANNQIAAGKDYAIWVCENRL